MLDDDFEVAGLLEALAKLPAGPTGQSLADHLGCDLWALWPILERSLTGGWVERWDIESEGVIYLLGSRGLAAVGLVLTDNGKGGWHYRPAGFNLPPDKSRACECNEDGGNAVYRVSPDASPMIVDPVELAIIAEHADRLAERFTADPETAKRVTGVKPLPPPTRLLGSTVPWRGEHVGPCPVCLGRTLAPCEYCLKCSRWGLDHLVPPVPKSERPKAPPKFKAKVGRSSKRKAMAAVA